MLYKVITFVNVVVQAVSTLAWPLLALFSLLLWKSEITRLLAALIDLASRVRSAKVSRPGGVYEVEIFPPEEIRPLPALEAPGKADEGEDVK